VRIQTATNRVVAIAAATAGLAKKISALKLEPSSHRRSFLAALGFHDMLHGRTRKFGDDL
jgi:hypothetical protein